MEGIDVNLAFECAKTSHQFPSDDRLDYSPFGEDNGMRAVDTNCGVFQPAADGRVERVQ